jgi:hypothetical protein
MGKMRNANEKLKGRDQWEDLVFYGSIILK